jgi:hypothetical protein
MKTKRLNGKGNFNLENCPAMKFEVHVGVWKYLQNGQNSYVTYENNTAWQ